MSYLAPIMAMDSEQGFLLLVVFCSCYSQRKLPKSPAEIFDNTDGSLDVTKFKVARYSRVSTKMDKRQHCK